MCNNILILVIHNNKLIVPYFNMIFLRYCNCKSRCIQILLLNQE